MLQVRIVEFVNSFCYLGSTMRNEAETDVDNRLNTASIRATALHMEKLKRVRHLTFFFSTSTYFVNGNTLLMSDLPDN